MRRFVAPVAFGVLVVSFVAQQPVGRAQSPQQPSPRFTAGVDVVEMDVSVWDKDRKPVRGLKAEDFTVFEDGKPQKIVAFFEVYTPPPVAPSAPWMRDVAPDVEANDVKDKELFVIVLDDANLTGEPRYIPTREANVSKAVARAAVERLQPGDLAAVIFSNDSAKGQPFTSDRSKLLRAIDAMTVGPNYNGVPVRGGGSANSRTSQAGYDCRPMWLATDALRAAVEALSSVPHRRKSVFFVSVGPNTPILGPVASTDKRLQCIAKAQSNTLEVLKMAQRANVNVYSVDPGGLRAGGWSPGPDSQTYLVGMAENTGGRAIVDTNDEVGHLAAVMEEMRAYYLLGYELTDRKSDGRFHRVEVKVNRPGVEVHSRSTRYDARPDKTDAVAKATPTESAVAEFLPKDDLRVEAAVAPFVTGEHATTVQIALTVRAPAATLGPRDQADLLIRAFTPDGRAVGAVHETVPVTVDAASTFELASRIELKPGRYSLRIAVTSKAAGRTGSVYTDVTVPDFSKEPLALSGVVMTASSGSSLRGDALTTLVPTTTRAFSADDRIQAFLRVYQGGSSPPAPVAMKLRIVDEHNTAVVDRPDAMPPGAFAQNRQADYSYRLPLSTLKPGEYWLSIEAAIGKRSVKRDVRFTVR